MSSERFRDYRSACPPHGGARSHDAAVTLALQPSAVTSTEFAAYCRRIRLADDPAALALIRPELDHDYPTGRDSDALVLMATLKRVRLLEGN